MSKHKNRLPDLCNYKRGGMGNKIKTSTSNVLIQEVHEYPKTIRNRKIVISGISHSYIYLNHRKLWYVRYTDEMLFGFTGSKIDANYILEEIKIVIEKDIQMEMHLKKSGIKHHTKGIIFLGYRLLGVSIDKLNWGGTQRRINTRIKFFTPIKMLMNKYAEKGFLQVAKKGKNRKYVAKCVDK
jgi:hypothetical protein